MPKDLRSFLDQLEAGPASEFATITAEVDPNLQLTGIIRRLQADNRHPVLYFERIKGTAVRVVANTLATRDRLGTVFGCRGDEVVHLTDPSVHRLSIRSQAALTVAPD